MKFRFRLQKILELAQAREDQKKRELSLIQARIQQLKDADKGVSAEMLEILATRLQRGALGEMGELRIEALRVKALEINEMLKATEDMKARCLREIQKEFGKRKALESLRAKKEQTFKKEKSKLEQKSMEDRYRHANSQKN